MRNSINGKTITDKLDCVYTIDASALFENGSPKCYGSLPINALWDVAASLAAFAIYYYSVHCYFTYSARLLSGWCVSPPSWAIRNRRL